MSDRMRFHKADNNKIRTPSISWGYGQQSEINLIQDGSVYQIWHKPYTRDWFSHGETCGYPAIYMLVEVHGCFAEVIEEVSPGVNWRKERKRLIEKCLTLNEERKLINGQKR